MRLEALTDSHDRQRFDCGQPDLNAWLARVAGQHQAKGLSKTFVAFQDDKPERVCGYYALTLTELDRSQLADSLRKKLPQRVPGVRLGRLAVDLVFQRQGLGQFMLVDALMRARRIHVEAGGIGLFVDAKDEQAAAWYHRFGFVAMPDQPLLLFYPVGAMAAAFE